MLCVVPLAGPDFYDPSRVAKPFLPIGGQTLIKATLGSRSWLLDGAVKTSEIVFVLKDTPVTADARDRLQAMFPGARFVVLSSGTGGALLSALCALGFAGEGPVILDLADLAFESDQKLTDHLVNPEGAAGVIPWFHSADPAFSYLQMEGERVMRTAEKTVISDRASAGVYGFRTPSHFLRAAAGSVMDAEKFKVNGALFVCPSYNVLIDDGMRVTGCEVSQVYAYSKTFHNEHALSGSPG